MNERLPRYSALVAGASMPVAAQVSLTGVRNPLASCSRVVVTASYHVEGVEGQRWQHKFDDHARAGKNGGRLAGLFKSYGG